MNASRYVRYEQEGRKAGRQEGRKEGRKDKTKMNKIRLRRGMIINIS